MTLKVSKYDPEFDTIILITGDSPDETGETVGQVGHVLDYDSATYKPTSFSCSKVRPRRPPVAEASLWRPEGGEIAPSMLPRALPPLHRFPIGFRLQRCGVPAAPVPLHLRQVQGKITSRSAVSSARVLDAFRQFATRESSSLSPCSKVATRRTSSLRTNRNLKSRRGMVMETGPGGRHGGTKRAGQTFSAHHRSDA